MAVGYLIVVSCYLMLMPLCPAKIQRRLLGGDQTTPHSIPYVVAIVKDNDTNDRCTGALIHEEYVLTVAQCVVGFQVDVILGSYDLTLYESQKQNFRIPENNKIVHSDFNEISMKNNIALLKLPRKAILNMFVGKIALADENSELFIGEKVLFIGWGHIFLFFPTNKWQQAELTVIGNNKCRKHRNVTITEVCATTSKLFTSTADGGDAGGLLIIRKHDRDSLIGVASIKNRVVDFGPVVFTRLSSFHNWVKRSMSSIPATPSGRPSTTQLSTAMTTQSSISEQLKKQTTSPTKLTQMTTTTLTVPTVTATVKSTTEVNTTLEESASKSESTEAAEYLVTS